MHQCEVLQITETKINRQGTRCRCNFISLYIFVYRLDKRVHFTVLFPSPFRAIHIAHSHTGIVAGHLIFPQLVRVCRRANGRAQLCDLSGEQHAKSV